MSFDLDIRRGLGARNIACTIRSETRLIALIGPSGAGKTSVLNMIAGLLRPDAGHIAIGGTVLFDHDARIDLPPERRRAGYVFQDARLFPHMRVRANLAYGERFAPRAERWMDRAEAERLLDIAHLAERWPATLSGGETRRVAIGRALLAAPRFLLLDEPLTSLNAELREEISAVIERIRDALELPILLVSHDAREVTRLARDVVTIDAET